MMKAALLATVLPGLVSAEKWAVIAAGSSGYFNYRHQADACHAYHVLRKGGVPEQNIIVMMQDDVANAEMNPFKGQLFNKPGDDAVDVYAGCKIDYRGKEVTAKLFTSVITGDTSGVPANGKVLKSGPNDDVFLNFVDHGGVGIVAFPNGEPLHVKELSSALKTMQQKKMFDKLVFYMEACESGSMFPDLTADGKIFAVTAANAQESSWGFYCGSDAVVKGKNLNSCLGDLFSIAWMEDSDVGAFTSETIDEQVKRVTKRTNKSHVMSFGDKSFLSDTIGNFEMQLRGSRGSVPPMIVASDENAVGVRDIPLAQAIYAWEHAKTPEAKADALKTVEEILAGRKEDETLFRGVVESACSDVNMYKCVDHFWKHRAEFKDLTCHQQLSKTVFTSCPRRHGHAGGWNAYSMQFSQVLVNLCEGQSALGKDADLLNDIIVGKCSDVVAAQSSASELVV
eukprot:TRINITY_DN23563_c0_g1_i1.p1 TRINITY_DN23563_c0_g1~~TRINITY_DN23563_c0_g1_i1.p1  ORF type:complete len:454 (-),score=106.83 TRINITY_DN23563_c0_g1_i1:187-1548(-)